MLNTSPLLLPDCIPRRGWKCEQRGAAFSLALVRLRSYSATHHKPWTLFTSLEKALAGGKEADATDAGADDDGDMPELRGDEEVEEARGEEEGGNKDGGYTRNLLSGKMKLAP